MSRISEWADRMKKIIPHLGRTEYLEKHCPYKSNYFCNGKVNKSKGKNNLTDREPCKYLINGKRKLNLHLGRNKRGLSSIQ